MDIGHQEKDFRFALRAAFPASFDKPLPAHTRQAWEEWRQKLCRCSPEDVIEILPLLLDDSLEHHVGRLGRGLEFLVYFLDVAADNAVEHDPTWDGNLKAFCDTEVPPEMREFVYGVLKSDRPERPWSAESDSERDSYAADSFALISPTQSRAVYGWLLLMQNWRDAEEAPIWLPEIPRSAFMYWFRRSVQSDEER